MPNQGKNSVNYFGYFQVKIPEIHHSSIFPGFIYHKNKEKLKPVPNPSKNVFVIGKQHIAHSTNLLI